MRYTPREELETRIDKFQKLLAGNGIDEAVIVDRTALFYFSGTTQTGQLFVPSTGEPLLFIKRDVERATRESALQNVIPIGSQRDIPGLLEKRGYSSKGTLGLELDLLPVKEFWRYQEWWPDKRVKDVSPLLRLIRTIKSDYELEIIEEAGRLHSEVFRKAPGILREGMSEVALAGEVESLCRQQGHLGNIVFRGFNEYVFYGQIMAGANASLPSHVDSSTGGLGLSPFFPQGASMSPIKRGEPIFIDVGGCYQSYVVDETRIFAFGRLSPKLEEAHQAALEVQDALVKATKPGAVCEELFELAIRVAEESGFGDYFLGATKKVNFVGHGVGLEINEFPIVAKGMKGQVEEKMVISYEPKFVFPGEGVVGIENTFIVERQGLRKVTMNTDNIFSI